jgi:hypothetical protein
VKERDICERLEAPEFADVAERYLLAEAATVIRIMRDTLRRADELLAEGAGIEGDAEDWRARVRAFLGERS